MSTSPHRRSNNKMSVLACIACRKRHLKCDGTQPICMRCTSTDTECIYVRSRRGFRSRSSVPSTLAYPGLRTQDHTPQAATAASGLQSSDLFRLDRGPSDHAMLSPNYDPPSSNATMSAIGGLEVDDRPEHLIAAYYEYIQPAHPFILPRKVYMHDKRVLPDDLRHIMCFMASHALNETLRPPILNVWLASTAPDTGFKVQAMLLFALCSFARFEREDGARALVEAQATAARIGLHLDTFALDQPQIMRESWRRTWWELYTVSGLISLVAGVDLRVPMYEDLSLPGHCLDYEADRASITCCQTMARMRQRSFSEPRVDWSSFAYRVEASRILTEVLALDSSDTLSASGNGSVHAANALVSGFVLSLPKAKRTFFRSDGTVDEIMSCALMIIDLASICLHFPRSGFVNGEIKTVCGNGIAEDRRRAVIEPNLHRFATLRAANNLSANISTRQALKSLSPCFSCAITFAAAVHLAAHVQENKIESLHREHINLELIALDVIGGTWPIAKVIKGQLADFARQVVRREQILATFAQPCAIASTIELGSLPALDEQWLQDFISMPSEFPVDGFYFNIG